MEEATASSTGHTFVYRVDGRWATDSVDGLLIKPDPPVDMAGCLRSRYCSTPSMTEAFVPLKRRRHSVHRAFRNEVLSTEEFAIPLDAQALAEDGASSTTPNDRTEH
jgi:hypothetical protein